MAGFSSDLEYALVKYHGVARDQLPDLLQIYIRVTADVINAPEPDAIEEKYHRAVYDIQDFNPEMDTDWFSFLRRIATREEIERDANNPYMPRWDGKTDDKPTMFSEDTGTVTDRCKTVIMQVLRDSSPKSDRSILETMAYPIIAEMDIFASILESMKHFMPFFVQEMGDSTEMCFKWSKALPIFGGLGLPALRFVADIMETVHDDWGHYTSCPDKELIDDVISARIISGYPVGLLRCDFHKIHDAFMGETMSRAPQWWGQLLLLHILKHSRYFKSHRGKPHVYAAYKGRDAMIPLPESGFCMPMSALVNQQFVKTFCDVLRIPKGTAKSKNPFEIKAGSILNFVKPLDLPEPLDMRAKPELIYPTVVKANMVFETKYQYRWINPGISINNIAKIDVTTGVVSKNQSETGPYALSMAWPHHDPDPYEFMKWKSNLPSVVPPMRPSHLLRKFIKNVNDLGEPEGFNAIIDGNMFANFMRLDLYGSVVGNTLANEYSMLWFLPMDGGLDNTTNQGKTNTARILAGALVPGIQVVQAQRSASAPAQRAVASAIEQFGTAIYDEFVTPKAHEHFLNQQGLQALSTGGIVTPGRAQENSTGVRLKYMLFLVAKICSATPDIRNRSFAIFLDAIKESTKLNEDEMGLIMSGQAAQFMRLCALRYMAKYQLVEKTRLLKLAAGKHRFNATMAICEQFADRECIERYLLKSEKQMETQYLEASASGLADDIGLETGFNVEWFYQNCDELVLEQTAEACKKQIVEVTEFTRNLIENHNRRSFERVLSQHRTMESALFAQARRTLASRVLYRPGWVLRYVKKEDSQAWNKSRNKTDYIILTREVSEQAPQTEEIKKQA